MAEQATKIEEVSRNCPACKKILKKRKRYYRNGAYYCTKSCFKKKWPEIQEEKAKAKEAKVAEKKEEAKAESK